MGSTKVVSRGFGRWLVFGVCLLAVVAGGGLARAAGPEMLDATVLFQMEQRAELASPREQCFRYAELLVALTELEGRQIAAGEDAQAHVTMQRMDAVSAKVHAAAMGDAKRLKNAEQMLEHATRRVSDMAHVASAQEQAAMQATLQHMNSVHNELLTMVFAH